MDTTPRSAYLLCIERIPVVTCWEGVMQQAWEAVMMTLALAVSAASMVTR